MRKTLLLVLFVVSCAGCQAVKLPWAKDKLDEIDREVEERLKELKDKATEIVGVPTDENGEPINETELDIPEDAIDINKVVWHGVDPDVVNWVVTHKLTAKWQGNGIYLEQTATRDWPKIEDGHGGIVASPVFFKRKGGKIHGHSWDFMRPGQKYRHFPFYPPNPAPGEESWETIKRGEEDCWVMLPCCARGTRRNGKMRTNIIKMEW